MSDKQPLPADIPPEAAAFLDEMGYREPDRLRPGDAAPDVPLLETDGTPRRSSELWAERPAVLIFGSYT